MKAVKYGLRNSFEFLSPSRSFHHHGRVIICRERAGQMISEHFRVASMSLAMDRGYFDRGRRRGAARGKVIGPKMKKRKLGRALESVREDFRVGKHTGLSVRFSPRSFSSPCRPRRSIGLLSSSYRTNSLFVRAFFVRRAWRSRSRTDVCNLFKGTMPLNFGSLHARRR